MKFKHVRPDCNSVTINRLTEIPLHPEPEDKSLIVKGAVLDTETTGLNNKTCEVIEIGVRTFNFRKDTGQIIGMDEEYGGLQDQIEPLTPFITKLTGITDDDLRGKAIDWMKVDVMLSSASIVIAYNSGFDRPFVEKYSQASKDIFWGCAQVQIDWPAKGFDSYKLELLSIYHGFFVDAHRAIADVDATLNLIGFENKETGKTYLHELCGNAKRQMAIIDVDKYSKLKGNNIGYRWRGQGWWKKVYADELEQEIEKVSQWNHSFRIIPPKDNFKGGM